MITDFPRAAGNRTAIVVMAKPPVPGQSKTRLCPPLTPTQAAKLHRAFLQDTLARVATVPGADAIAFTPAAGPEAASLLAALAPPGVAVVAQRSAGLGDGLAEAVDRALAAGYTRALLVDSDSPSLPVEYLTTAVAALAGHDVALGPCDDGGYYLIGLKGSHPPLFQGIAWSTAAVLQQTRAAVAALGLSCGLLPPWYDVDTPPELDRIASELAAAPQTALHTHRCLAEFGLARAVAPPGRREGSPMPS